MVYIITYSRRIRKFRASQVGSEVVLGHTIVLKFWLCLWYECVWTVQVTLALVYTDVSGAGPLVARACAPVRPSLATPLTIYLPHWFYLHSGRDISCWLLGGESEAPRTEWAWTGRSFRCEEVLLAWEVAWSRQVTCISFR